MLEGLFPSPGWSWIEIIVATITIFVTIIVIIITIFKNPPSQLEVLTKGVSPESLLESACWYQRESLNAWYQFHCNCQCCHYNHNLSFLVIVVIDDIIDLLILAGVCMYRFAKIKQRKNQTFNQAVCGVHWSWLSPWWCDTISWLSLLSSLCMIFLIIIMIFQSLQPPLKWQWTNSGVQRRMERFKWKLTVLSIATLLRR